MNRENTYQELVMTYSPILGVSYELQNVTIEDNDLSLYDSQPWEWVYDDERERITKLIVDAEPITTSYGLHLCEQLYIVEDELFRFIWVINSQVNVPTIEKKRKKVMV